MYLLELRQVRSVVLPSVLEVESCRELRRNSFRGKSALYISCRLIIRLLLTIASIVLASPVEITIVKFAPKSDLREPLLSFQIRCSCSAFALWIIARCHCIIVGLLRRKRMRRDESSH